MSSESFQVGEHAEIGEGGEPVKGMKDLCSFPYLAFGLSSLAVSELCPFIINWLSSKYDVSLSPSSKLMEPTEGVMGTSDL